MSFILLILIGIAVYVLWFHKFTMPDGTIVKGLLAKNKAEQGNNPRVFVAQEEDSPAAEEPAPQSDGEELNIQSAPLDFDDVLDAACDDPFGIGWKNMQAYFGWLLLGASREDLINNDNVWLILSNGYDRFRTNLRIYYKEQAESGEVEPDAQYTMPEWFANVFLLNGFNTFIENAEQYFDTKTWNRIVPWCDDLYDARNAVPEGPGKQVTDEPNAAEFLVRLYTILQGEEDSMIAKNTEMFKQQFSFDFDLPLKETKIETVTETVPEKKPKLGLSKKGFKKPKKTELE